ncbi:hypothetical protein WMY93_006901 [Mugilogobius chulae]|uniref:Uncharacterized protein n=1 Tax=Mugilogobius chulae TaxID=88201 RepID=A0AAW0PXI6_9GOBI
MPLTRTQLIQSSCTAWCQSGLSGHSSAPAMTPAQGVSLLTHCLLLISETPSKASPRLSLKPRTRKAVFHPVNGLVGNNRTTGVKHGCKSCRLCLDFRETQTALTLSS